MARFAPISFHAHSLTLPAMSSAPKGVRLCRSPRATGLVPDRLANLRRSAESPGDAALYQWNTVGND
jgi:hypothetical protein